MTELTQFLYEYIQKTRFRQYLDYPAYEEADRLAQKSLEALKRSLSGEQLSILEKYENAQEELQSLEFEALFQAAWAAAREL